MPQTRLERIVAFAGLLAIAVLVALVVPAWLDYRDAEREQSTAEPAAATPPPAPAATAEQVAATAQAEPRTAQPPKTAAGKRPERRAATAAQRARLVLAAVRGDCWLLVRRNSESGATLYQGVLAEGERLTFTNKRLWIRLGAGEQLDVTLNGKPVKGLPRGVAEVVATGAGVRPA